MALAGLKQFYLLFLDKRVQSTADEAQQIDPVDICEAVHSAKRFVGLKRNL
jgi:hypothetical protein